MSNYDVIGRSEPWGRGKYDKNTLYEIIKELSTMRKKEDELLGVLASFYVNCTQLSGGESVEQIFLVAGWCGRA